MNKLKRLSKNLFILIVACFVVIPIVINCYNALEKYSEGFKSYDGKVDSDFKMDRVDICGQVISMTDGGANHTGVSGEYLYCPAGEISCQVDGETLVEFLDQSYNLLNGSSGSTYWHKCRSIASNNVDGVIPFPEWEGSGVSCSNILGLTKKYNFLDTNNKITTLHGTSLDVSLAGFVGPYSSVPLDVSNGYVYLYNDGVIDISSSPCFLYEETERCVTKYMTPETKTNDTLGESPNDINGTLKCLANNGAEVGDDLCCGQDGVVQNTKYNCPADYPNCVGYKCGESWGRCKKD